MDWKLGGLIVVALSTWSCSAEAVTGEDWLTLVERSDPAAEAYAAGAADAWMAAVMAAFPAELRFGACPPDEVTPKQVVAIGRQWAMEHPEEWHFPAAVVIVKGLWGAYPCPTPPK